MRRVSIALLLATGCGRLGYSQSELDGGPQELRPAIELTELSVLGAIDDDPTLTADQLEIYFKSNRAGSHDIYRAVRPSIGAPWSAPEQVAELATPDDEDTPEVSADGLELHFSSPGASGGDLYRSTRTDRAEPWGVPVRVEELSSTDADYAAAVDGSGRHVVLTRLSGGMLDLFRASRGDRSSPWGPVAAIDELDTEALESDAWLDASGTVLYFTSNRAGGAGGADIWRAIRAAPELPFDAPSLVAGLATAADEGDPWVSPDGRTIYFARAVGGDLQLHVAER